MDNKQFYEYIFRGGGKQIVTTLPDGVHRQFDAEDVDLSGGKGKLYVRNYRQYTTG